MTKNDGDVTKHVLPNGLTVLLKEDHSSPVVAINVWFGVGSANETEEENGLAHFQEHMVFKGTKKRGVGDIANSIKGAGGNLNAGTSYSYTMYYVVMPTHAFSLGLDVQSDTMMNSTFPADEFKKERLVVIDEAKMYDDTPDSYTFYRTMELGYDVHNYRRPIAGYEHIVREFTLDQLVGFYKRYYRPANATLVIVGDIEPDAALKEVERAYGGWQNGSVSVNDSPAEPVQKKLRFKPLRGSIDLAYFSFGFHVPNILDPDYPALEMLATLLGSGRSSRLYQKIIEEKQIATSVSADLLAEKWPGYFMMFASGPVQKWNDARDVMCEELARFQNEKVTKDELLKARRQVERSMYSNLETVEGQASSIGYYQTLGDYRWAQEHRNAIRNVTADEVMYVARKYFAPENCSVVSYLPKNDSVAEPELADIERSLACLKVPDKSATRPAVSDSQKQLHTVKTTGDARVPKVEAFNLKNGVRVLVKTRPDVPMVSVLTILQGGLRAQPAGQLGISTLGSRMLLQGTRSFAAEEIVRTIEGLGGSIETYGSFDVTGSYVSIVSSYLDEALPVFEEVLRQPTFKRDDVEKEKSRLLDELAKRHDHPIYYSIDRLFQNVFGDHPYAHPSGGREADLAKLTDANCRAWYEDCLSAKNATIVFVGDITRDKAESIAERLLGDVKTMELRDYGGEAPGAPKKPGLHELRRPDLRQAVGLVGFLGPVMMSEDAISLSVLNGVMTGLGGRLFVELRDKRSLGYMTGSSFLPLKDRSMFYGFANPGPEGVDEAIDVILNELERVTKETVSDEELNRSKEWLVGTQVMRLQRNLSQAMEYGVYESLGFGYDVVNKAEGLIRSVTKEDILKASASIFDRDKAVMVKLLPEMQGQGASE